MAKPITFNLCDASPPLLVQFSEADGLRTKKAVAVVVSHKDMRVIGSTGFDQPACLAFSMIYEVGSAFAGGLYRNGKTVGDVMVGKDERGLPYLKVQLGRQVHVARLEASDIASLKSLFEEIGGSNG